MTARRLRAGAPASSHGCLASAGGEGHPTRRPPHPSAQRRRQYQTRAPARRSPMSPRSHRLHPTPHPLNPRSPHRRTSTSPPPCLRGRSAGSTSSPCSRTAGSAPTRRTSRRRTRVTATSDSARRGPVAASKSGPAAKGPQLFDALVAWDIVKRLRVRAGQFKAPFGYRFNVPDLVDELPMTTTATPRRRAPATPRAARRARRVGWGSRQPRTSCSARDGQAGVARRRLRAGPGKRSRVSVVADCVTARRRP